jgi:hypothetical protein
MSSNMKLYAVAALFFAALGLNWVFNPWDRSPASPAGTARAAAPAAKQAAPAPPAPVRVTETSASLPANLATDDIRATYEDLTKKEKSEFETSGAFQQRLQADAAATRTFLSTEIESSYDADKGVVSAFLNVEAGAAFTDVQENAALVVVSRNEKVDKYQGTTALGARMEVTRTVETTYGLAARPVASRIFRENMPSRQFTGMRFVPIKFPMAVADAREAITAKSLRLLFLAPTSAKTKRRTIAGTYTWGATIKDPTEERTDAFGVYVDVDAVQVWVVNVATKEILVKTTLKKVLGIA